MARTGRLGSANAQPGKFILASGSRRGRVVRRGKATPLYRVQVLSKESNFAPGAVIAEFDRIKNLAYADYANSVPEAFFTLHQDDPKIGLLRDQGGRAHVRVWRNADLVWTGWVALERDANSDDAIFYCYGYLSDLFWLLTGWKQSYTNITVGNLVSSAWSIAKGLTFSRLAFVKTGVIQDPMTVNGGSTPITLPTYEAFKKRYLYLMQEMAAIGASDTGQATMFEITHSLDPTFNFFRNHRRTLDTVRWEYNGSSSGKVQSFREYVMPVYHRNIVFGVGQNAREATLRKEVSDGPDLGVWGRMEEPLFFSWVRDETELDRALKLRLKRALMHDHQLTLSFYPGAETPPNTTESRWRIGDQVPIKIDRGVSYFDGYQDVSGYMVSVLDGQEYVRALVQESL